MTEEKKSASKWSELGAIATTKAKSATKKKAPAKKMTPKPASYCIADGRAITAGGRIYGPGEVITVDQVADMEALIKGGYVVKA
jgi:hypothetical protein